MSNISGLIESDLKVASAMLKILNEAASVPGVTSVKIIFRVEDGDVLTADFCASGDPAIMDVQPAPSLFL